MTETELKQMLAKSPVAAKNNIAFDKLPESKATKKVRLPEMSANTLTKHCLRILDLRGFYCWRQNNGAVYDEAKKCYRKNPQHLKGVPDVIGFHRKTGVFISVEIKAGKDKLSIAQIEFLKTVTRAKGLQFVIRNMDDLEAMNKELFRN